MTVYRAGVFDPVERVTGSKTTAVARSCRDYADGLAQTKEQPE